METEICMYNITPYTQARKTQKQHNLKSLQASLFLFRVNKKS